MQGKLIQNTVIVNAFAVLNKIIQFLFILLLSKIIGSEGLGQYATASTTGIFSMIIISFGSNYLLNRAISRNRNDAPVFFWNALIIRLLVFIVLFVILIAFQRFLPYNDTTNQLIIIFIIISLIRSVLEEISILYQSFERFLLDSIIQFAYYFTMLAGSFFLLKNGQGLIVITYFILINYTLFLFINIILVHFYFFPIQTIKTLSKKESFLIIKASLPFFLSSAIGILYHRIDILMLGYMQNEQVVGYYYTGYNIYEALLFIPASFGIVLFPKIVKLFSANEPEKALKYSSDAIFYILILMIPAAIGISVFAKEIIILLFGAEYLSATLSLQIVVWGLVVHSFNNIIGRIIYAINKERFFVLSDIISLSSNVVLNIFLIPRYSLNGAAIATIISFMVSFGMQYYCVFTFANYKWLILPKQILSLLIITIVFYISTYLARYFIGNMFVCIGVLSVAYFVFVMIFDLLGIRDRIPFLRRVKA